jgi:hypothetical protein
MNNTQFKKFDNARNQIFSLFSLNRTMEFNSTELTARFIDIKKQVKGKIPH